MTCPKTVYLPSRSGPIRQRDVDLAVGLRRDVRDAPSPPRRGVQPLPRDLGDADRLAARRLGAASPVCFAARRRATADRPTARETRGAPDGHAGRRRTRASRARRRARRSSALRRDTSRTRRCPCVVSTTITGAGACASDACARQSHDSTKARRPQRQARQRRSACTRSSSVVRHRFDGRVTPICGQCGADRARPAARIDRPAHVLAPRHEVQVDVRPPPLARALVQRLLGFFRRAGPHPAEAVRDAVHVRVDADVLRGS